MELIRRIYARIIGRVYVSPQYRNKWAATRKVTARAKQLRDTCEGWDDPDERCPRKPKNCVCWQYHGKI